MLVEDDNNLREIYGARLLAEGHEIVAAKDGEEALALAVKEKPDLIISDVMMPRISGFDMLDILRNAPETKNTKVIMMTALSQAEDKARADKLGADRYLVKSQVTLEDVAKAVRDVIDDKPGSAPIDGASGVAATDPSVTASTSPTTDTTIPQPASPAAGAEPKTTAADTPTAATPSPDPVVVTAPAAATPSSSVDPQITAAQTSTSSDDQLGAPLIDTEQNSIVDTGSPASTDTTGAVPSTTPVALDPPVSPAASMPVSAVTEEPSTDQAATTPATESIKVELPSQPPSDNTESTFQQPPSDSTEVSPSPIGPNLNEALQQEEKAATPTDVPINTDEPAGPSIINGAENLGVITPTVEKATEPEIAESTSETSDAEKPSANPLDDTPKKKVIAPINDLTKTPDLAAMAAAEEGVGSVVDPTGEAPQVVEPDAPPVAPEDHNKIAL